ncbi:hypothetical protein PPYR_14722 [Photinus pyralis]|uniref:Uncharacterized protein n=1 Tax=Photinus pyralis TaxID=7054 RepID=A0A5N4A616_PHOPY|nr:hypothetical protein PPYR_14722 [Photinus pyralis]
MQRVLSGQTAGCIETSEEVVSKRLCFSFVIVCAFFSVVGGFFLGRYTKDHDISHRCSDERITPYSTVVDSLTNSAKKINNLTLPLSLLSTYQVFNCSELYSNICYKCELCCSGNNTFNVSEVILYNLKRLEIYYFNISVLVDSLVMD